MAFADLLTEFKHEYGRIADLVAGLTDEQLARKVRIPMFKESPIGEYPTLATFVEVMADRHLGSHIDHMREILGLLGVAP